MKLRRVQFVNISINSQRSMLITSLTRHGHKLTSVRWSSRLSSMFSQAASLVEDATAVAIGGYAVLEGDWIGQVGGHASL